MENASKALIIAGAILLSILIISLGIMIFNSARDAASTDQLDQVQITSYNEQFTQYEGTNKRGADANGILDAVRNNNITNSDDESRLISVKTDWTSGPSGQLKGTYTKAPSGKTYKIECGMDTKTGYVTSVTITTNS